MLFNAPTLINLQGGTFRFMAGLLGGIPDERMTSLANPPVTQPKQLITDHLYFLRRIRLRFGWGKHTETLTYIQERLYGIAKEVVVAYLKDQGT